jgi:acetyl esterase
MGGALHPDLVAASTMIRAAGLAPPQPGDGVADARAYSDALGALLTCDSVPLRDERHLTFAGPHGAIPAKLYCPDDGEASALLFYAHGGGFRQGTLAGWDSALRLLARTSGVAVLSIDYRLAPEHPFPAGLVDVLAVMRDVIAARAIDGIPLTGFAAGGDSAGANLVLAAALAMRDAGEAALRYLLLFYGVYSTDLSASSWQTLGGAFGLSVPQMEVIWADYLAGQDPDWQVEPIRADLSGLPPARLVIGTLDPLFDENIALDASLRAAGVASTLTIVPGANHGIVRFAEVAPVVSRTLESEGAALRAAFA